MKRLDPVESFWAKAKRGKGCWLWQAGTDKDGYGLFSFTTKPGAKPKQARAPRFSWTLANGPIPAGLWVLHTCDTPACVRPSHLFLGDNEANVADRGRKGRDPKGDAHWARIKPDLLLRGSAHGRAKLDENDVRDLRREYPAVGAPLTALSRRYGVSKGVIWHVLQRRTWKHVS